MTRTSKLYLMEFVISYMKVWTLPIISDLTYVDFILWNGIIVTISHNEFAQNNDKLYKSCLFPLESLPRKDDQVCI